MIRIENVSAGYLKKQILKNINLNIEKNSFFGIIGKNGSGKSTLLKVIARVLRPYSGNVFINLQNIDSFLRKDFAQQLSFLPQYVDTSLNLPVKDFIMFGRYPYMKVFKIPTQKDYAVVNKVVDFLKLSHFLNREVNELSSGEKQLVLIAQVLVQETDVILFDEPTSYLDIGKQNAVLGVLREVNIKFNKTIILSLHDLNAASEFCDKVALMENGKVYKYGKTKEVLNVQNIEKIYDVKVIVGENPISKKTFVLPITNK
ncbi:MAG: ABC transporter ATP-binding protein [Endomicrobium sp.]|jgi:iron complex transport system ATP-binding protein|uniref:ABC transporter ATP-binding protein n=1 Tax=Candidatus Endomicrobiellum cubanum TaxID=3242325 RepID=UPI002830C344|nr:ABC transporter ATP-binding protein [Endomicrobium sp.]MDR2395230.1 ABC transporter ATP-binding protein [Endomicrobium sp.]